MSASAIDDVIAEARPRLVAIAYRMLGSMNDAEDVVQESIVKARAAAPADLREPVAYLTTITTRTAVDHLRSARVRRESYVGPWLPEPVLDDPGSDAAAAAEIADSLSMAFLVLLESLSPEERAVLLLHDVFGHRHAEVAEILDRSEASSRQLLRRARQQVEAGRSRFDVDRAQHEALVRRFRDACERGEVDGFVSLLTDDAVYVADGGSDVKAARYPIHGPNRISRFLAHIVSRSRHLRFEVVHANGEPAMVILHRDELISLVTIVAGGPDRIDTIRWVRNPDKLARVRAALAGDDEPPA